MPEESLSFDVIIVGAGVAGLSAGIQLAKLSPLLSICILEKGATVGAHILSGAVLEPRALNELIPDWQQKNAPVQVPATNDHFWLLTHQKRWKLPVPSPMKNHGNYIISLENLCQWLAQEAETLGVSIFSGFAATDIIFENNKVRGVITGPKGLNKEGKPTPQFQPGIRLYAKQTLLAEGCHGSLTKYLMKKFNLKNQSEPQTYGLGIKELWEVDNENHSPGTVIHTIGWPLDRHTYGGSFLYHLDNRRIAAGFVVGLDYQNPYLDPFQEFQRFKTHPAIRAYFQKGQRICYGARALCEGGYQSIPRLTFPGGMLIGDTAGFLNVPKIKGIHTAMKSGMVAADTIFESLPNIEGELTHYTNNLQHSWLWKELYAVRNIRPAFCRGGLWGGLLYAAIDTYLFKGKTPWNFKNRIDHTTLKKAKDCKIIDYPKPDEVLTFNKLSSVYFSNTFYRENQPCHLKILNEKIPIDVNLKEYASPETRYCPAAVYEILYTHQQPHFHINPTNCIQCKTCDIKDPMQNILWVPPEGGDGTNYIDM